MKDLPGTRYKYMGNGVTWEVVGDGNVKCVAPSTGPLRTYNIGDTIEDDRNWASCWIRTEPKERLFTELYLKLKTA